MTRKTWSCMLPWTWNENVFKSLENCSCARLVFPCSHEKLNKNGIKLPHTQYRWIFMAEWLQWRCYTVDVSSATEQALRLKNTALVIRRRSSIDVLFHCIFSIHIMCSAVYTHIFVPLRRLHKNPYSSTHS